MNEQQARLARRIHEVWGRLPTPDWQRMEGDFEEAELSRWLSGLTYHEMFEAEWVSDSVWHWCRPDVAAYYLGGHLLRASEMLSRPWDFYTDYFSQTLAEFLCVACKLNKPTYREIAEKHPAMIPVIFEYGQLLRFFELAGSPEQWMEDEPWPEEPAVIQRILGVWKDPATFVEALDAL